jgi:phosphate:Na+ symporter
MNMKRSLVPVAIAALSLGFWLRPDSQEIAAGVAIFLFGMLMPEDGFGLFSGGVLERMPQRATGSTFRAITFGIVSTTVLKQAHRCP